MSKLRLFHTGSAEVREPDIRFGRKNADFGQGFYLTPDMDFACLWAGTDAVINEYELDEDGLLIRRFSRDADWFDYIFHNRRGIDRVSVDVVIGPIANDTIFETLGIISSGYLKTEEAMRLLLIGPEFTQAAVKTEKALSRLRWICSRKAVKPDAAVHRAEQDEYAAAFAAVLQQIMGE